MRRLLAFLFVCFAAPAWSSAAMAQATEPAAERGDAAAPGAETVEPTPPLPEQPATPGPEQPVTPGPEQPATPGPEQPATPGPEQPATPGPGQAPGGLPSLLGPLDPEHGPTHDWSEGRPRWFVSGAFDMGFLYLRPRFSAGWGKPHHSWVGVEANPLFAALFAGEGLGGYAGLRGSLPAVDLRAGGRYFYTFQRSFLCPTLGYDEPPACAGMADDDFYSREDIESRVGPRSVYLTWETELTLSLPLGPGAVISELALSAITEVEKGYFVFEEQIKVVANPPWVWRARVGYEFPLDVERAVKLGVVAELVSIEGRDLYVLRGGLVGSVRLFHDLEARGLFVPVIAARDTLGAAGGDTFLLSLRYRWATN